MKRMTIKLRQWLKIRSRTQLSKIRKAIKQSKQARLRKQKIKVTPPITIKLPKELNLLKIDVRDDLIEKLQPLFDADSNSHLVVDFYETEKMHADATLLIYSLIEEKRQHGAKIKVVKPWHPKILEVLRQIGLLPNDGQGLQHKTKHEDIVHWKTTSGKNTDPITMIIDILQHCYEEHSMPDAIDSALIAAFGEAMCNSVEHAYQENRNDELDKWWMFTQVKDKELTVVICDLGMGIPKSLETNPNHRSFYRDVMNTIVGKRPDKSLIEKAIEYSTSRHPDDQGRGKGLSQIVQGIDAHSEDAKMIILSNYGSYSKKIGGENSTSTHNYDSSIGGTIIGWVIPLNKHARAL
jgi:hypothetical protein